MSHAQKPVEMGLYCDAKGWLYFGQSILGEFSPGASASQSPKA